MVIQLKKGRDGPSTLACVRADGSWSKEHPFFPLHDLTHSAVESVLDRERALAQPLTAAEVNEAVVASRPPAEPL